MIDCLKRLAGPRYIVHVARRLRRQNEGGTVGHRGEVGENLTSFEVVHVNRGYNKPHRYYKRSQSEAFTKANQIGKGHEAL